MCDYYRNIGKQYALGVLDVLGYAIAVIVTSGIIMNVFNINIDPTDKDGFNRSGLKYYKDYGTGKEYISGKGGCLIER